MSENVSVESDLNGVAESLLESRPDLADPDKLRLFEEMLHRQAAKLLSDNNRLRDAASTDRPPTKMRPDEKFMWFVLDLSSGVLPAVLIAATFPRFPLPLLPVIVVVGFFASRHLIKFERPGG